MNHYLVVLLVGMLPHKIHAASSACLLTELCACQLCSPLHWVFCLQGASPLSFPPTSMVSMSSITDFSTSSASVPPPAVSATDHEPGSALSLSSQHGDAVRTPSVSVWMCCAGPELSACKLHMNILRAMWSRYHLHPRIGISGVSAPMLASLFGVQGEFNDLPHSPEKSLLAMTNGSCLTVGLVDHGPK